MKPIVYDRQKRTALSRLRHEVLTVRKTVCGETDHYGPLTVKLIAFYGRKNTVFASSSAQKGTEMVPVLTDLGGLVFDQFISPSLSSLQMSRDFVLSPYSWFFDWWWIVVRWIFSFFVPLVIKNVEISLQVKRESFHEMVSFDSLSYGGSFSLLTFNSFHIERSGTSDHFGQRKLSIIEKNFNWWQICLTTANDSSIVYRSSNISTKRIFFSFFSLFEKTSAKIFEESSRRNHFQWWEKDSFSIVSFHWREKHLINSVSIIWKS